MSDTSEDPWPGGPYAPQIPYIEYYAEKRNFAGYFIGPIIYGIITVLFFKCMGALLGPTHRTGFVKWGLVTHTGAMFSFLTIMMTLFLHVQSISYIDNREFPGAPSAPWVGTVAYQLFIYNKAINVIPFVIFLLNNWLADGLLLYRCCIIYSMNYWIIAFPCLMYLTSMVLGVLSIYQTARPIAYLSGEIGIADFGTPLFSISLSLNVLLTLMIVIRLFLHDRSIRKATGARITANGLYNTVNTMLVESCAIYAITFLLYIGPWATGSSVANLFFTALAGTQVIAPFLLILRVANRTALTSDTMITRPSLQFGNRGKSTDGSETIPDVYPMSSIDPDGGFPNHPCIGGEESIDEVSL